MDGFLSTFPPYSACAPPPRPDGSGWVKRQGCFITPQGLSYLELCKAIISQVSPGLPPPIQRALTRECGVQVNAKVDQVIQCSLGPKTLLCPEGEHRATAAGLHSAPPVSNPRFPRPVSIYSPVFDRRICPKKLRDDPGSEGEAEAAQRRFGGVERSEGGAATERAPPAASRRPNQGSSFQLLEQRYGFFHCKKCNIRWESAYVWCISGTSKVYYKQLCRGCQLGSNPYRVESILCKGCLQTCCCCDKKQRHLNMKRPHRQDLCCRCRGLALSCHAAHSFKNLA